jgi:hypothetical protein
MLGSRLNGVPDSLSETNGNFWKIPGKEIVAKLPNEVVAGSLPIRNLHERGAVLCSANMASVCLLTEPQNSSSVSILIGVRQSLRSARGARRALEKVRTGFELLAVRQDHFLEAHRRRAIPVAVADNRDFVARLQRVLVPAMISQPVRTRTFRHPFHYVAALVGDGEGDLRVRINPVELNDGGPKRRVVAAVVHRHRMMRQRRPGNH